MRPPTVCWPRPHVPPRRGRLPFYGRCRTRELSQATSKRCLGPSRANNHARACDSAGTSRRLCRGLRGLDGEVRRSDHRRLCRGRVGFLRLEPRRASEHGLPRDICVCACVASRAYKSRGIPSTIVARDGRPDRRIASTLPLRSVWSCVRSKDVGAARDNLEGAPAAPRSASSLAEEAQRRNRHEVRSDSGAGSSGTSGGASGTSFGDCHRSGRNADAGTTPPVNR